MKLIDYMRAQDPPIDDVEMARRIGDCTPKAVRNWKYGDRRPDVDRMARIAAVTNGDVSFNDWLTPSLPEDQQSVASA